MDRERTTPTQASVVSIPGFDVTGFIARGGMSRVYRGTERHSGRDVALKIVPIERSENNNSATNSVERLLSEAGLLAALSHPYLMPVHAIGDAGEWLYVAMSYAAGGDLGARIGKGLTVVEALRIATCVGQGLDCAHAHGLVHRDVKPGNVLFMADDTPVLSDFGLAKPFSMQVGITAVGMVLGSPEYMSPEQAMGQALDGRTDVYSLGAMLFAMLTGTPPYRGTTTLKTVGMHLDDPVPTLSAPHQWLQPLITHSMAKAPDERFRSAAAMAKSLAKAHHALQIAIRRKLSSSA